MNQKQLLNLLFVGLVLGGLGLLVHKQNSAKWEGGGDKFAGAKVLGEFPLNDVTRVTIKNSGSDLTLAKKNDAWVVADRGDYPADFSRVGNLIQGFWDLKSVQEIKVGASQLGRMDLITPTKGAANTGTLVELLDKDSKPLASLLLGKKYNKKSPGMEDGYPAGRYVMPTAGANASKVSLVSETLDQAEPKAADWLNKTFVGVDKIQSVAVSGTSPEIHWKMTRATDEATDWKLDGIKADEKLDTAKVPSFTSTFGTPNFLDVLPVDAKLGDNPSTVTVETFENVTYTFKIGTPHGENYPISVSVTANAPRERKPGKDEKPADKKRLDDEFAAKLKTLDEKVAKEKALPPRLYVFSKSSFDPVLKKRSELLEEKKPTPTPSPSPAVGPKATLKPLVVPAAASTPAPTAAPAHTPISVTTPPLGIPEAKAAATPPSVLNPTGNPNVGLAPATKPGTVVAAPTPTPTPTATPTPAATPTPTAAPAAASAHTPVTVTTAPVSLQDAKPATTPAPAKTN